MYSRNLLRLLPWILGVIAVVAMLKLAAMVWHEMLGTFYQDVSIYLAIGRGLLNGWMPYRELFETKPPGIFFLSALSIKLFNGPQLILWSEALLIGLFPLWLVYAVTGGNDLRRQIIPALIALLFGILITLFTATVAGQGLSESFGAFFATGVIAIAVVHRHRFSTPTMLVSAALMLLAVGTKEPFLISLIGGAVFLSVSLKDDRRFVVPLALGGAVGVIIMLVTGMLVPYVTIYLGHMLGHQMAIPWGVIPDPLWLRTIDVPRVWSVFWGVSPVLPFVMFWLWLAAFPVLLLGARDRRAAVIRGCQWLIGSWMLTLSVGISGDFYAHQFVFMVPGFAAIFFLVLRERAVFLSAPLGRMLAGVWMTLLALCILFFPIASLHVPDEWHQWVTERQRGAAAVDAVLDRCHVDRYLLLINANEGIQAYTRHSPYGPLFFQYARFIGGSPIFMQEFSRQFQTAPIAVDKIGEPRPLLDELSIADFYRSFTTTPPACAGKDFVQPEPYHILFRRSMK